MAIAPPANPSRSQGQQLLDQTAEHQLPWFCIGVHVPKTEPPFVWRLTNLGVLLKPGGDFARYFGTVWTSLRYETAVLRFQSILGSHHQELHLNTDLVAISFSQAMTLGFCTSRLLNGRSLPVSGG